MQQLQLQFRFEAAQAIVDGIEAHDPDAAAKIEYAREMDEAYKEEQEMTLLQATETVRDYVCARCYGPIAAHFNALRVWVVCANHGTRCNGSGYVTKAWAERQRSNSIGEAMEVRFTLRDIIPSKHAGKSEEQLLKELGF
jgi:hypothetical protein